MTCTAVNPSPLSYTLLSRTNAAKNCGIKKHSKKLPHSSNSFPFHHRQAGWCQGQMHKKKPSWGSNTVTLSTIDDKKCTRTTGQPSLSLPFYLHSYKTKDMAIIGCWGTHPSSCKIARNSSSQIQAAFSCSLKQPLVVNLASHFSFLFHPDQTDCCSRPQCLCQGHHHQHSEEETSTAIPAAAYCLLI